MTKLFENIHTVAFDLDGTLFRYDPYPMEKEAFIYAKNHLITYYQYPLQGSTFKLIEPLGLSFDLQNRKLFYSQDHLPFTYKNIFEYSIQCLLSYLIHFEPLNPQLLSDCVDLFHRQGLFINFVKEHKKTLIKNYHEIPSLLKDLKEKNKKIILITNSLPIFLPQIHPEIIPLFDQIIYKAKKPSFFHQNSLHLKLEHCLFIGDSADADIIPAKKAGWKTLFTNHYPLHPKTYAYQEIITNSDLIIDHVENLLDFF